MCVDCVPTYGEKVGVQMFAGAEPCRIIKLLSLLSVSVEGRKLDVRPVNAGALRHSWRPMEKK